eukprot:CAMPEP_0197004864 /NCGR_PEP_ID=MMETSP1380-20130617/26131_1 /TAXON_ID=5936 /ORGANISM="Euplotes crassus, Strain CT5" /LENGTH=575 /DNA_ID=CAMNT_0042423801 /DNA_START=20 /DNA_END=1747 /DNA_ORIENTATION=-
MIGTSNANLNNNTEGQRQEEEKQSTNPFNRTQSLMDSSSQNQVMGNGQMMGQQDSNKPQNFDKEMGEQYNYSNLYSQMAYQDPMNVGCAMNQMPNTSGLNPEGEAQALHQNFNNFNDGGNDFRMGMMQSSMNQASSEEYGSRSRMSRKGHRYPKSSQWSTEEDTLLGKLYQEFGSRKWKRIATEINKHFWGSNEVRKGKQCRERWINHLDPEVNKGPFTVEEDILMIEIQLETGNRWAYISTFLKGRTENQVKNRFKTLIKKYVLSTYGKSYYENYLKEIANRDEHEYQWKNDPIVNSLLEAKRQERDNSAGQSSASKNVQMNEETKAPPTININDLNAAGALSAFQKVGSNFLNYSRNASSMNAMNSQPVFNNNSLDYLQEGKNLINESIYLNNSLRSMNSVNSGMDQQNNSMGNMSFNNGQSFGRQNLTKSNEGSKEKTKGINRTPDVVKSTIPRASIDLMGDNSNEKKMRQDTSNIQNTENAQMEVSPLGGNNTNTKNQANENAKMDSVSNSSNMNLNMTGFNSQNVQMNPEMMSIYQVKQMAVRKFIDSENEENMYILHDGTIFIECIKTG